MRREITISGEPLEEGLALAYRAQQPIELTAAGSVMRFVLYREETTLGPGDKLRTTYSGREIYSGEGFDQPSILRRIARGPNGEEAIIYGEVRLGEGWSFE